MKKVVGSSLNIPPLEVLEAPAYAGEARVPALRLAPCLTVGGKTLEAPDLTSAVAADALFLLDVIRVIGKHGDRSGSSEASWVETALAKSPQTRNASGHGDGNRS
jgi:hypothetical protein